MVLAALSPVLEPETVVVPVIAKVGVEEPERTTLLTEVGVMAPSVKARAPAVLVAETPFPVVTPFTNVPDVGRVTEVAPERVRPRP